TLLLGMKFGEHEYKVMGLAPYAPASQAERAHEALRSVFALEPTTPARFAWKRRGPRYRQLLEATPGLRFGAGAAGGGPRAPGGGGADGREAGRRAPGAGRGRVHERQGQRAARRGAVAARPVRVPVVRRRVERGRCRVSRLARARRGRGAAASARARLSRTLDRRSRRRDADPHPPPP